MKQTLKLSTDGLEKDEEKKRLELVDFQHQPKIKPNDMEKYLFEALQHPKYPSFHEVIGPVLAGFCFPSFSTLVENLFTEIFSIFQLASALGTFRPRAFWIEISETSALNGVRLGQFMRLFISCWGASKYF